MTLDDIERMDTDVLLCKHVASVLHASPATIHAQAVLDRDALGFPVIVAKSRVFIPKEPFLRFMRGSET